MALQSRASGASGRKLIGVQIPASAPDFARETRERASSRQATYRAHGLRSLSRCSGGAAKADLSLAQRAMVGKPLDSQERPFPTIPRRVRRPLLLRRQPGHERRKRISPGGRRRLVNLSRARVVLARSAGAGKSRESLLPHESICPRKLRYESFENLFLAIRKNGWILKSSRDALDAGNLFHATIPVDTANAVQSSSPESGTRTLLNITAAE
jgi:hypothetical protein